MKCPFLIVAGKKHLAPWYAIKELPDTAKIAVSATAYANHAISLEWIYHFDEHSANNCSGEYRQLILDGYGSHHTREFLEFAASKKIIVFGLPPKLTHLLQPLDVVIYSPMKHWHSEAVNRLVRNGLDAVSKADFFEVITEIRTKATKEKSIKSAFRKTGIWPFNPELI